MQGIEFEYRALAQYAAILFLAIACWIWGGGPERAAGTLLLAMPFAELAYHAAFGPQVTTSHTDLGHAAMQIVIALCFLLVALSANRIYPLWLVSFQLIAVLSHVIRNLAPDVGGTAYMIMTVAPSYAMIAVLALGLIAHRRRTRKYGNYRSWRASCSPWSAFKRRHSRNS